ncbi:hypothetical protein QJQ45_006251 [Haematococcus lacustris]|nr:hypothetical protein QJQ45_006251 [Haematococcus lacustris]
MACPGEPQPELPLAPHSRVAVVGSGIAGLSAAWLLHRNGFRVTLFEKDASCGGHTLTDATSPFKIDLGFQASVEAYLQLHNNYAPLLSDYIQSFALSIDNGKLEWGSDSLDTIFAQRKNLASPSFLAMVSDVIRFGKEAPKVLSHDKYRNMTLGSFLHQERYSKGFIENYVLPMCAAVWSVPNAQVMEFPVQMLIRFWVNHHLLDLFQRPLWRVVRGRSQEYVKRVLAELPDVRTSTGVQSAVRAAPGAPGPAVRLTMESGEVLGFDAVVFATHSDITLRILGQDADASERDVLGAIPYNDNDVYLHTGKQSYSLMYAILRKVWASWNCLGSSDSRSGTAAVCVSYWANRLQHLPAEAPDMFVTLNPPHPPAADKVIRRLSLAHPVFRRVETERFKSWEAQGRVQGLQGQRATYFAGAWCGYGFHEDGIKAAVSAVKVMGCRIPWELRPTCPKVTLVEGWYQGLFDRFAKAVVKTGYLRLILPNGSELSYGDKDYVHKVKAGQEWRGLPEARATLRVYNMDFFRKIVMRHDTGLGEAYMDKDFEADNLGGFMAVILANAHSTEASRSSLGWLNWVGDRMLYLAHLMRPNTIEGSRRNIGEHYDAGNDMYRLFLDESMMYSCAMHAEGDSLYEAQMRKLDAIIDAAGITAGQRVLEVGCGWGAFAIRAVQRTGCHVTGLTLSKEQLVEAEARVKAAGLQDSISLRFCDYRDCPGAGSFDRVVSIEMIEAVGHANLGTYFRQLSRMLKPGGVCVLQAICCPDERYTAYCRCSDFIREHIFPGGHLPCIAACVEAAQGTGLSLHSSTDIGPDYAVTLREWRARWEARKDEVLQLGYSERFWRKYRFYFVYCEAGFDAHYIHTFHMTWVKDQEPIAASATQPISRQSMSATTMLSASAAALTKELPSDPITQVLLALYFFLAGMLVKGHPHMFLLPLLSCVCVAAGALLHSASLALVPKCSFLSPGLRSWWCTLTWQVQPSHLLYSAAISVASLHYVWAHPEVLSLQHQPADKQHASVVVAASSGFFAFHLWLCVRQRLTTWTLQAIVQYTLLLLMYGVAIYKCVPFLLFLAITLSCELSSVFIPDGYLQHPAGVLPVSARRMAVRMAEQLALVSIRILPHLAFSAMLVASPAAFIGGPAPVGPAGYCASLLGLGYMGWRNWRKAQVYLSREASPGHKDKQAL